MKATRADTRALRGSLLFVTPGNRTPAATLALVDAALDGGAQAVLLREPQLAADLRADLSRAVVASARRAGAAVILHRDAALARACGADGVHTGHGGASVAALRAAAPGLLVGRSAHWPLQAEDACADYLLLSPFGPTPRSHPRPCLLPEQVRAVLARDDLGPVLALGGLTAADIDTLPAGLSGLAVMRAIAEAADPRAAAAALRAGLAARLDPATGRLR